MLSFIRFGNLTALLSDTVLDAFTIGSAINISASQLKSYFGIPLIRGSFLYILIDLFKKIKSINWITTILSTSCFILLLISRYINRNITFFKKIPLPGEV